MRNFVLVVLGSGSIVGAQASPSALFRDHVEKNPGGCIVIDAAPFVWSIVRAMHETWGTLQREYWEVLGNALTHLDATLGPDSRSASVRSQVRIALALVDDRGDVKLSTHEAAERDAVTRAATSRLRFGDKLCEVQWQPPPGRFALEPRLAGAWRATNYLRTCAGGWTEAEARAWRTALAACDSQPWHGALTRLETRLVEFGGAMGLIVPVRVQTMDERALAEAEGTGELGLHRLVRQLSCGALAVPPSDRSLRGSVLATMRALVAEPRPAAAGVAFPETGEWKNLDAFAAAYVYIGTREVDPHRMVRGGRVSGSDVTVIVDPRARVWSTLTDLLTRVTALGHSGAGAPARHPLHDALALAARGAAAQVAGGPVTGELRTQLVLLATTGFLDPDTAPRVAVELEDRGVRYKRGRVELVELPIRVDGAVRQAAVLRLGVEFGRGGAWQPMGWELPVASAAGHR